MFPMMNLRLGYHQLRIRAADIPKTIIQTHDGYYEFLVISFRLTNDLVAFMDLMTHVFILYLDSFAIVLIDDILVYSQSFGKPAQHRMIVL